MSWEYGLVDLEMTTNKTMVFKYQEWEYSTEYTLELIKTITCF